MSQVKKPRRALRTASPAGAPVQPPLPTRAPDGITSYTWVWYLLSIFVPFAGVLIALFLYDQENWNIRKIGRNCLLISFVLWVLLPIFFFMLALLVVVIAVAGTVSDAVSPTE